MRGSSYTNVPLHGHDVSASIDEMLRLSGPPTFPPRYLAARRIGDDGLETALDGYAGDVLIGGSYYGSTEFLSKPERWLQAANRLADRRVRQVGADALTDTLYETLVDRGATGSIINVTSCAVVHAGCSPCTGIIDRRSACRGARSRNRRARCRRRLGAHPRVRRPTPACGAIESCRPRASLLPA